MKYYFCTKGFPESYQHETLAYIMQSLKTEETGQEEDETVSESYL